MFHATRRLKALVGSQSLKILTFQPLAIFYSTDNDIFVATLCKLSPLPTKPFNIHTIRDTAKITKVHN